MLLRGGNLFVAITCRASCDVTGMNDEDDAAPHLLAIQDIQRVEKEDIDRITSSLVRLRACMWVGVTLLPWPSLSPVCRPWLSAQLDTLPLTDQQKNEMAGAVEQVAVAGINGAVWGSMVAALLLILLLNFVRN